MPPSNPRTIAIIDGGITGLAAAWELSRTPNPAQIILLEASPQLGGKLALGGWAVGAFDAGAESILTRRPEALQLIHEAGLGAKLVHPQTSSAWLAINHQRQALPTGTLMGIPGHNADLTSILGPTAPHILATEANRTWAPLTQDTTVAAFIAQRLGQPLVDLLVEPILGGIYAGRAAELSLQASLPTLWDAAQQGQSITNAVTQALAIPQTGPAFAGLSGGLGQLPAALATQLAAAGAHIHTNTPIQSLRRTPTGWQLTREGPAIAADAVLLACPAPEAGRLLQGVAGPASDWLRQVEYASVALISIQLARSAVAGLTGSGVLIPGVTGGIKAATFSSTKWAWQDCDPHRVLLRASVGRHRETADLELSDAELTTHVLRQLRQLPGITLGQPEQTWVNRWPDALPQYAVGHPDAVARVRAAVAGLGQIALAGAAYDGVGIPACVASAQVAARALLAELAP